MNYFELYDIPVSLKVDGAAIKKKFYTLSRVHHPDFYSQAGEQKQVEALEKSADINKAHKIFQDQDSLIRYVLELKGLIQDEEKYVLKPTFLTEVMDINEQLMEVEMEPSDIILEKIEDDTNELLNKIYGDVESVIEGYKEGISEEEELLRVKDYYYRKKYLKRILDKITQLRNIATP